MRTSPIHYIAPSSIEITPNANNSYNDLAVYIAPQTKIKVYCPRLGIGTANGTYAVWQLYGRNRRLNDSRDGYSHTKAYTIYARLSKADSGDGYIVFTPKQQYGNKWYDKYSYITKDGLSIRYNAGADSEPRVFDDANYWYVKLGEVSAADSTNQRTVNLDTGILGTDQWNSEWALNPDALPLRIDMEYRLRNVADEEWDEWTAITRYVRWNQVLHVKAQLVEGWTGTDINRFHHWEITRDTGNADADGPWNEAHDGRDGDSGDYTKTDFDLNLVHLRGIGDDFNGVLQALFTFTAYELNPDYTAGSEEPQYLPLISSSFSVIAETVETFDLEESSSTVTYNPQTGDYSPAIEYNEQTHQYSVNSGVTIRVRAKDADGNTFYPTDEQISAIGLYVYYLPIGDDTSNVRRLTLTNGRGTLPSAPFLAGKSVEVWLQVGTYSSSSENVILSQKTITYIRFGETGPAGGNTATVMLYKRSSDAVTSVGINTTLYYKFSTPNKLYTNAACTTEATSSNLNDWSLTIPNDSTDPIYVTAATTYSNTESDDITSNEWVTPAKYTENGAQGAHGVNTATIFLYKRSQNAISSHGITAALYYKFSDGKLYKKSGNTYTEASDSDRNNWLLNIPASDGNPCYVIQAAALSTEDYDQIATTDWSGVRKLVEDGKSITKKGPDTIEYVLSTDGETPKQGESWSTTRPTPAQGEYVLVRTTVHWSDDTTTVLISSERNPNDGAAGMDIVAGTTTIQYQLTQTNVQPTSGWGSYPATLTPGWFLWSKATTPYYKDHVGGTSAGESVVYNVSYIAEDGKTGRGIQSITEYYQATNSSEARQAPSSETGWDSDPNLSHLTDKWNQSHKYLWNMEKTVYSNVDGTTTTEYSIPQILAIWTKDGAAGKGIDSIQNYYKVQATEPSLPDDIDTDNPTLTGWSTSPSNPPAGQHLWNFERITWIESDDTNSYTHTAVHSAGYTGTNGENAIRLDLDNEHEDMLYSDSQTLPIAPSGGATSAIHLYDGSTEMTSGFSLEVDFAKSSGVPGISAANHPTISNGVLTVPHITANTAKVVVKATYNSKEYFSEFTANKTMQDKYDLQLTPNSISYNPATYPDGGVTIVPSVRRTDLQGNITSVNISTTESEGNVCLYWALVNNDGTHGNLSLLTTASCPASGSTMAASGVYFELRKLTAYVNGVWQYRMCDYDTVPFTKAENGTPADVWTIDSEGWWCKNGVRTTTKAEGKDGTGVEIKGGVDSYYTAAGKTSLQSLDLTNVVYGDCYIVNDDSDATHGGHLYFFLALTSPANWYDNWRDLGKIKGEPGTNGTTYYVHYAYADTINLTTTPISGTGFVINSNGNKAWMGIVVDTNQYDPGSSQRPATNPYAEYEWNKVKGAQGEPGADAVDYKIEFTDNTFALDPNTNKSVIYIKGVVYRTEGSNTPTQVSLTGQDLVMRFVKNDGTTQELYLDTDFGIQNNEFVTYAGNGSVNTNFKTFIVEYKPDGQNILARGIIALTVYGEKGMDAISGYADYLYSVDDQGQSKPAPTVDKLGNIDLLRYSGNQNRIEICELVSGSYVWKGYGKTDYPDGTMFVCKIDNHIYRASASGWVDEGRFKGDNAVVYKIDFTDSTFAYDPGTRRKTVDVSGIVYKADGGNTSIFTRLSTDATLKLYLLRSNGTRVQVPANEITINNGAFSTDYDTDSEYNNEKNFLAVLEIDDNEVARANIPIEVYGSRGKRNRVYYYAQPWQNTDTKSYLVNDAQAPYFLYNDNYYVFNPDYEVNDYFTMAEMGTPSTANPEWQLMDNTFKFIITEAIFGSFAHFGSFVINGDWLFSQIGRWRGDTEFDGGTSISCYVLPYTQGDEPVSVSPFSLINEDSLETYSEAIFTEKTNSGASQPEVLERAVQMDAGKTFLMFAYDLSRVTIYLDGTHYTQYSVNGTSDWHDDFASTDKYMRVTYDGMNWNAPMKIVNEGSTDTDYSFGISSRFYGDNQDGSPSDITTWNDTPVSVTTLKPYLWAKAVEKDENGVPKDTTYIRLTGEVLLDIPFAYNEDTRIYECLFQVPVSDSYDIVAQPSSAGATMSYSNLNMYKEWFSPNVMINGLNGKASMNNVFVSGTIQGSGNFTEAGIGSANIRKMHSGGAYSGGTWIDIENGRLDISRYSKVRVVEWSSNPSATGVKVLGYLYVDSSGTIKVSSVPQDFYNPNKGNIPAT